MAETYFNMCFILCVISLFFEGCDFAHIDYGHIWWRLGPVRAQIDVFWTDIGYLDWGSDAWTDIR